MSAKARLDQLLVTLGHCESRERARTTIMSGLVYVDGQKQTKAGLAVPSDACIEVRGDPIGFVSRGGLKLDKALTFFDVAVTGLRALDVGASTGGFTDCLLKRGVAHVAAVDVGYGQFDWTLRNDPRVTVRERCNIRYVKPEQVGAPFDMAVVDVSFISLKLVFPVVYALLRETGQLICLMKPQFEAGRDKVGKKGVVREEATHKAVLTGCIQAAREAGFALQGLTHSPIKGPHGNIEFLGYWRRDAQEIELQIEEVVAAAHTALAQRDEL